MSDEDPGFFSSKRIAIMGLGLMGGSLAMALHGKCAALLGIDPDPLALRMALEQRVVDQSSSNPSDLLPQADVIILAAPVNTIIWLLKELPNLHPGSAIVLDLGSTKEKIVESMRLLPQRFDPLGGHPMCGKEKSSLANADPALFEGAPFAFTPLPRTTPQARSFAGQLASAVGARPLWLDPATHDRWVAATSHLPYVIANALAFSTPPEVAPMIGPGYKSTSRLSVTSSGMMMDVLMTNRENIVESLRRFRQHLARLENLLASGEAAALADSLSLGAKRQKELIEIMERGKLYESDNHIR